MVLSVSLTLYLCGTDVYSKGVEVAPARQELKAPKVKNLASGELLDYAPFAGPLPADQPTLLHMRGPS